MNLIKSPLNYTGGKFKLLPQILPFFPKDRPFFIDLFGGGSNVSINVENEIIIYNDSLRQVVEFLKACKQNDVDNILIQLESIINHFRLSKENEESYYNLRDSYNSGNKSPMYFYALVCHSFNNQIRFNKKGEFNLPFGKREFGTELRIKFTQFIKHLKTKNISFINQDFRKCRIRNLEQDSFIYADPPYLISTATYNESGGWTEKDEIDLLNMLDDFSSRNVKFALSNVLENKGSENKILKEWSKKYNIHNLESTIKNSNYQRTKEDKVVEVLITNY